MLIYLVFLLLDNNLILKYLYIMFSENKLRETHKRGSIEVICGSMFSGKTEELIRRLKRAKIAKQNVEIFKPTIDNRYSDVEVVSHDSNSIHSTPVENSASILLLTGDVDVVGIDERSEERRVGEEGRG